MNEKTKRYSKDLGGWSMMSVPMVESGLTPNMYAAEGTLFIDCRLLPGEDIDAKEKLVRDTLDALKEEKGALDYSYVCEVGGPGPAAGGGTGRGDHGDRQKVPRGCDRGIWETV